MSAVLALVSCMAAIQAHTSQGLWPLGSGQIVGSLKDGVGVFNPQGIPLFVGVYGPDGSLIRRIKLADGGSILGTTASNTLLTALSSEGPADCLHLNAPRCERGVWFWSDGFDLVLPSADPPMIVRTTPRDHFGVDASTSRIALLRYGRTPTLSVFDLRRSQSPYIEAALPAEVGVSADNNDLEVRGSRIYFLGHRVPTPSPATSVVWVFDWSTGASSALAEFPAPLSEAYFDRKVVALFPDGERLAVHTPSGNWIVRTSMDPPGMDRRCLVR